MNVRRIILAMGLALLCSTLAYSGTIWTTGTPNYVYTQTSGYYGGASSNRFGYRSGFESATAPERWAAVPFRLDKATRISQLDAYYTDAAAGTTSVEYIIWKRDGLSAPNTIAASGTLGAYVEASDIWGYHEHALDLSLPQGDYYLTIYGAGAAGQPASVVWLTGGASQDPSLERDSMWRSSSFATSGFEPYTFSLSYTVEVPSAVDFWGLGNFFGGFGGFGGYGGYGGFGGGGFGATGFCCSTGFGPGYYPTYPTYNPPRFQTVTVTNPDLLADAKDVYNPAFTMHGVEVPELATANLLALAAMGIGMFAGRRRLA